jgi:hypothetical protein
MPPYGIGLLFQNPEDADINIFNPGKIKIITV